MVGATRWRRAVSGWVLVVAVAALGAWGCDGGDGASGGGADVGLDAALDVAPDVGLDVAPDVGPDGAQDAVFDAAPDTPVDAGGPWDDLLADTAAAAWEVHPGVETVTVMGAAPKAPLTLYAPDGAELVTVVADDLGYAHFSYIPTEPMVIVSGDNTTLPVSDGTTLPAGAGYVLRDESVDPVEAAGPFQVLGVDDVPDPALYEGQQLHGVHFGILGLGEGETELDGFNYLTMRDGVKLSATVRFPDPLLYGDGPYPTVIEYSGYSTSRPDRMDPGSNVATLLGFATVGVNMRGTGCSGGVFDVFNPAQHADGYDVVEIVARQPWVLHNKVGMVGLSYSGIAQLLVAYTRPPSLAAIAPLSVLADPWEQLWPGGIYNDGFTRQWLEAREAAAQANGQSWTDDIIAGGDTMCAEHQLLRGQNIDFGTFFRSLEFYPSNAADRSPKHLVDQIDVPVYLTGAFQDEQTGAQFTDMLDRFTGAATTKFTLYNGRHVDGYAPLVLTRWYEFLSFYVAQRVPRLSDAVRTLAGPELGKTYGVDGLGFEPDRFADFADDDYEGALAAYEAEPTVRVLFESGAAGPEPGAPLERFEADFDAWPTPSASPWTVYLGAAGALEETPPTSAAGDEGVDTYLHDPDAGSKTFFGPKGYQMMAPLWDLDWTPFPADHAVSYLTAPLDAPVVLAGSGYADLWVASEAADAQVQVTLTEVRPDGVEWYLQSGWLRLGHRAYDEAASDTFRVVRHYEASDFQPLTPGEYVEARVALPSVGAVLRAGSQLRVTISSPGRDHGTWEFLPPDYTDWHAAHGDAQPRQSVAHTQAMPSHLVLSVVGLEDTTATPEILADPPPCPSLRGQPCRPYEARDNTAGSLP